MKIKEIIASLEKLAPPIYQESYDNSGLIIGDKNAETNSVLVCLDCLESVVDEAIEKGAGLIVAHHPIVFSGLKKITGKNYIERVLLKAIKNDIAIYAIHTNLDNMMAGVNKKIGEKLGLQNLEILAPISQKLYKLVCFVPTENTQEVLAALFAAGAGNIGNYAECSFVQEGTGTFTPNAKAKPHIGTANERHRSVENRVEVLVPEHAKVAVNAAMWQAHPYEEVAHEWYRIENTNQEIGAGMVGELPEEMLEVSFLQMLKINLNTACVRHTALLQKPVKKVAFCGGSGSFLLGKAMAAEADVFVTGDFKYHQFFDADGEIVIADVGHFESEQFTIDLIHDFLMEKFPTFAVLKTSVNTNPIAYV